MRNTSALFWGMQIDASTVESSMDISEKIKNGTSLRASNFTSGNLKKLKTLICKNVFIPMFIAMLFTIAKIWKQPKHPSVDE